MVVVELGFRPRAEAERRGDGGEWLEEKRPQMVWGVNN
jgi:hypothetical protein